MTDKAAERAAKKLINENWPSRSIADAAVIECWTAIIAAEYAPLVEAVEKYLKTEHSPCSSGGFYEGEIVPNICVCPDRQAFRSALRQVRGEEKK